MLGTAQMGSWLAGGGVATRNWMSHEYKVMAADLAGKDSWGKGKNCSFLNLTFKPSEPENCCWRSARRRTPPRCETGDHWGVRR